MIFFLRKSAANEFSDPGCHYVSFKLFKQVFENSIWVWCVKTSLGLFIAAGRVPSWRGAGGREPDGPQEDGQPVEAHHGQELDHAGVLPINPPP